MSVMNRPGSFVSFGLASLFAFSACMLAPADIHAQDASVPAEGLDWKAFEEAVTQAETQDKKLIVDVYAAWCPWCRRLQREVYTNESVQAYVRDHFVLTRLDAENTEDSLSFRDYTLTPSEMAAGLGASGFPTTVFLDEEGRYITRLPGFMAAPEFLEVLTYIGSEAFVDFTFEEYQEEAE